MTSAGWRRANRLIPPNVFYFEHDGLVAKYAVLSEADFHAPERARDPQRLGVGALRPAVAAGVGGGRAGAATGDRRGRARPRRPCSAAALPRLADEAPLDLWRRAFALTYSAELRAERNGRSGSVVDADPRALSCASPRAGAWPRRVRRDATVGDALVRGGSVEGKALSVLRLAKASATFAGGADYIAWKINRHAGTEIEIKPWQRRWPLLAAISLLPRLLRSGAVR